jgi:hypothetical protein
MDSGEVRTMSIDWKKLELDLAVAKMAATMLPDRGDGGSCNRDSVGLSLERANWAKMLQLCRRVGLSVIRIRRHGATQFLISPPGPGQAGRLTRQAEEMNDVLNKRGWATWMWWQAD